jgi:putative transposase
LDLFWKHPPFFTQRTYLGQKKNYGGISFWARGYFGATVGTDEEVVRAYIRDQEKEDKRIEQLALFK